MRRASGTIAALALALSLGACEWFSTMSDPADVQPHEREPWAPPEGSVALDGMPAFTLADVEGLLTNPVPDDSASRAVGAAYYRTFCAPCHGQTGLGNGPVTRVFPAVPAIATTKVAGYSDAYLFALITQGRGLMPDYGRIPKRARWDLIHHLRTLGTAGDAGVPARAADSTATGTATTGTAGGTAAGTGTADTAGGAP